MNERIREINDMAASCGCESHYPIEIDTIRIEPRAIDHIGSYLVQKSVQRVLLVADDNTYRAAGRAVEEQLRKSGCTASVCIVPPNHQGDVVADERSIVHLMLEVSPQHTELLIAVGSGTIHDIVRIVAFKTGKPFLSVPTAASVDGFNSKGAPIIVKGNKITIAASAPIAIFADLDILVKAPAALAAAGFGDMLGKFTSLFDWKFSHAIAGEPYCPLAAGITEKALRSCIEHVDDIAAGDAEGIRLLMTALIESGLAMLIFGQSHPASGSEHHLSHYWEMEYLRLGYKQLLHGAKVGAACAEISALYHREAKEETLLQACAAAAEDERKQRAVKKRWDEIADWLKEIPSPDQLRQWLVAVGGPSNPAALGLEAELVSRSLEQAHEVRSRYTLLRALNTLA
ncbi:sn-glycerol-1-phosphate dehydrogenase [Paenibacillus tarimensis]